MPSLEAELTLGYHNVAKVKSDVERRALLGGDTKEE